MDKRPSSKGMVSRTFRITEVAVRIVSALTEGLRTANVTVIDTKGDPLKAARSQAHLQPGEMILRAEIISDRRALIVMSPEEFIHYGRELEYIKQGEQT